MEQQAKGQAGVKQMTAKQITNFLDRIRKGRTFTVYFGESLKRIVTVVTKKIYDAHSERFLYSVQLASGNALTKLAAEGKWHLHGISRGIPSAAGPAKVVAVRSGQ